MHPFTQPVTESASPRAPDAFRALVDQHQRAVYGLAYDLTGNHHDAEDLMQDAFIKAYRAMDSFQGVEGQRRAWLYRIATNTYLNTRRKKALTFMKLRGDMTLDGSVDGRTSWPSRQTTPPDAAEQRTVSEHVEQALEVLSPKERSAFILRHYHDRSIREVAEAMDVAEGTIKSLLFRATKKLRQALAFYRVDLGLEE